MDNVSMDLHPSLEHAQGALLRSFSDRLDPSERSPSSGYENRLPGLLGLAENGDALRLEFRNGHLLHPTIMTWSDDQVNRLNCSLERNLQSVEREHIVESMKYSMIIPLCQRLASRLPCPTSL